MTSLFNILEYFENEAPTHMGTTYAISKIEKNFKIGFSGNWTKILVSAESA